MSKTAKARKERQRIRKEARRKRIKRDRIVTERYGTSAHYSCGRKVRYSTLANALDHARRYRILYAVPTCRPYPCPYCGGWHLTTKEQE